MTTSARFLNDTKFETVNTKFTTSILNETITKLALLRSAEHAHSQRKKEFENSINSSTSKFAADVNKIINAFYKITSDLKQHQNCTDFSGVSVAENEAKFLTEYSSNKEKLKDQSAALIKLEKDIANYRTPISKEVECILKCAVENRFIKTWERARRDQNDHFNRMLISSLQNAVDDYSEKIKLEERCILEIETYSRNEMDMQKAESARWSDKFDVDINKTEIDIQVATNELDVMKSNYENTVDTIRFRAQEMIDFVALKEKRASQKDSDLTKLIYAHREHLFAKCRIFSELI